MNIIDPSERIAKISAYLRSTGGTMTEKERLFAQVIKLNEEVGELCEAILHEYDAHQRRKEKEIDLDAELADVLITTLILAENRQKDIWSQVDKKLDKQFDRFGLELGN